MIEDKITIPLQVREGLHIKKGDVLEFDESASYLVALPKAWHGEWMAKPSSATAAVG